MFTEQELIATFPRLKQFAKKLARDNWEDLFQDTLEKAWRYRHTYTTSEIELRCWLFRIMNNVHSENQRLIATRANTILPFIPIDYKLPPQEPWIALQQVSKLPYSDTVIATILNSNGRNFIGNNNVYRFREKHRDAFI